MTKEEFEQRYAEDAGTTVERLRELGREAALCDCGDARCEGWRMAHVAEDLWFEEEMSKLI